MRFRSSAITIATLLVFLLASAVVPARTDEPDVVEVQHILVAFKKSVPGKKFERTKKEAEALAAELLERARQGEDFDALVKEHSDDRYPGMYTMTNRGAPLMSNSIERDKMVASFGNVAFQLEVGEVGITRYHSHNSPYGFHVIKRLK